MSHIEVNILHQDYVLTCPSGQETLLREAAELVDSQFQRIRNSSKLRSRERVGVLLAVNLAYENLELRRQLQELQLQVGALQASSDSSIDSEADALRLIELEEQAAYESTAAQVLIARLDAALHTAHEMNTKLGCAVASPTLETKEFEAGAAGKAELFMPDQAVNEQPAQELALTDVNTMTPDNDNPQSLPQIIGEAL